MRQIIILLPLILVTTILFGKAKSPDNLQEVTITTSKKFDNVRILTIQSKKTNIIITGTDENFVQLDIKQIAKHKDREMAEKEIKYLRFFINKKRKDELQYFNYFALPENINTVESILKTEISISVPHNIVLIIYNEFGNLEVVNCKGKKNINNQFGSVLLNTITGKTHLVLNLSDFKGHNLKGEITGEVKHGDIDLKKVGGSINIKAHDSKIELLLSPSLKALKLTGKNSDVKILANIELLQQYNYKLSTSSGEITTPFNNIASKKELIIDNNKSSQIYIKFNLGNIVIE